MNPNGETGQCQGCGGRIVVHSTLEHCPGCLVELGLGALPNSAPAEPDIRVFTARRFGDYELLEQLGRGGMGLVYRARHTSLNRTVALKMVVDSQVNSPLALRRFEIEAEAAARLQHPNIVSIFEIGSVEGQPFISMRFIEGESLAEKLARGQFGPPLEARTKTQWTRVQERVARLMATVAHAIHYAHQHGVIHRDIKPGNILIDAEGQPHLSDFGLAMLTDAVHRVSQTGALIGTLSYLAPEQATGITASAATDIYSLGAVLYELLTGDVPFNAPTPVEVLRTVTERPPQRPSAVHKDINRDLETICLKCLEKSPSNRYGSARALAEDLERWQRRETILARPVGPILRLGRWVRRYPAGTALILSLSFGFLVSILLVRIWQDGRERLQQVNFEHARELIFAKIGVDVFWQNADSDLPVSSENLGTLIKAKQPSYTPGTEKRFRIGMLLEEDPTAVIDGYAHVTKYLERTMSEALGYPLLFDLQLLHSKHEVGINALRNHQVAFLKIGAASYLEANKFDPAIRPLIGQHPVKNGVFFAKRNCGIRHVKDLQNKSIAVKNANSTVSMLGALWLSDMGIFPVHFTEFDRPAPKISDRLRQTPEGVQITFPSAIIDAVLSSKVEAGIETESVFMEHERAGELVVLDRGRFSSAPILWLASSTVPKEVADAFTKAMVALQDPAVFSGLVDKVSSYHEVKPEEIERLRKALGK